MAREPNLLPSATVTVSLNVQMREYLKDLVLTGFYGKNRAEAIERLLERAVAAIIENGEISRRDPAQAEAIDDTRQNRV